MPSADQTLADRLMFELADVFGPHKIRPIIEKYLETAREEGRREERRRHGRSSD